MKVLDDANVARAKSLMDSWPSWKRDYQVTKYKADRRPVVGSPEKAVEKQKSSLESCC